MPTTRVKKRREAGTANGGELHKDHCAGASGATGENHSSPAGSKHAERCSCRFHLATAGSADKAPAGPAPTALGLAWGILRTALQKELRGAEAGGREREWAKSKRGKWEGGKRQQEGKGDGEEDRDRESKGRKGERGERERGRGRMES